MLTIRPSPAGSMAVNAARQHRKVPVRLTPSVPAHMAGVVSANRAGVSTPAAQTSAPTWPAAAASANRRRTAASSLTSVGTGVARPPASLIRRATPSRARWSPAARTTRAPAAAIAAAVAAPIPRLAPVTTASRPASHLAADAGEVRSGTRRTTSPTSHSPVEALVCVQAQFQVKPALRVLTAHRPRNPGHLGHRFGGGPDVIGRHQETGYAIHDHLTQPAAPERHHGSPARLRLGGGQPEGLVPARGAQHSGGPAHGRPEHGPRHSPVNSSPGPIPPRADLFPAVPRIVGVAVNVDRHPGRASDVDR